MTQFMKKWNYILPTILEDCRNFGIDLAEKLRGTPHILEYGCGTGEATLRCATEFQRAQVLGVDVHDAMRSVFDRARNELGPSFSSVNNIEFLNLTNKSKNTFAISEADSGDIDRSILHLKEFDFIYSWCVFEHIDQDILLPTLMDLYGSMSINGVFYIKINPLYFSARGAHFSPILDEPWLHLRYEAAKLRSLIYKASKLPLTSINSIWHQYETLNKITADQLRSLIIQAGFNILHEDRKYEGVPDESLKSAYNIEALRNKEVTFLLTK